MASRWWHDSNVPSSVRRGFNYCEEVVDGKRPANKWDQLSCERHLKEAVDGLEGYVFSLEKADHVVSYIEHLKHIKGEWASKGLTITLEPWQCFMLVVSFGWLHSDTLYRRVRTTYWEVARKNAKSTIAGGVGTYLLHQDGEASPEVYTVAVARDQAKLVFDMGRMMMIKARQPGVEVFTHHLAILDPDHASFGGVMKPLHSEGSSLDGLSAHGSVHDELHAWAGSSKRDVYDVMETSTGSRAQSMIWNITTAGSDFEGICYDLRTYLTQILDGSVDDLSFVGNIWTIDKDDVDKAFDDEEVWKKANPNYGVSVYQNDMRRLAKKAAKVPSQQSAFLTKRLNVWVNAAEAWMNMLEWTSCADSNLKIEDFYGQDCWIGTDLSSRRDLSSQGIIFRDTIAGKAHYYNFTRHYLPEGALADPTNGGHYDGWARQGRLTLTPGSTIDIDKIEDDTLELADKVRIVELPFDPMHNSTQWGVHMQKAGFRVVEVRPTVINFSEPMKNMEAFVYDRRWHHDNCPVMNFCISNVIAKPDFKGNVFPRKEKESRKIDPVVATLMALNRAMSSDVIVHDTDLLVI